jgi:hypothetical protein
VEKGALAAGHQPSAGATEVFARGKDSLVDDTWRKPHVYWAAWDAIGI